MKLIIGLGNPGEKYKNNRHNVGHMVADKLKAKKTDTFMNDSGVFVKKMFKARGLTPNDLYIIHDDLDIKLGEFKIQFGKGPKLHNGLESIENELGTTDFWRVRVGVDNRDPENRTSGEEYVLQDFTSEEKIVLDVVIKEICKKLVTL
jgi:PTH1 family peptidyl-tRNA hydrolase